MVFCMLFPDSITTSTERHRLFWRLQLTGWVGVGLVVTFFAGNSYFDWNDAIWIGLFRTVFGFLVTCLLRMGYQIVRHKSGNVWMRGGVVFLICCAAGIVDGSVTGFFAKSIGVDFNRTGVREFLLVTPFMRMMLYWVWSILYFGINYWLDTRGTRLRLAEAEAAARTSELQVLRAQVNPHFLFNALGSILAESQDSDSVRKLTLALSDYLRFSLQQHGEWEPLGEELKALENYLEVEKARFEENLEFRIEAEREVRNRKVPNAIVQPLLENAIKYGQLSGKRPLRIGISAVIEKKMLIVTVRNSGEWVDPAANQSTKTGLANLRRRLQLLYGNKAHLYIEPVAGEVCARIQLPVQLPETVTEGMRISRGVGA